MVLLKENDYEILEKCPWDGKSESFEHMYNDEMECEVVKCKDCGAVFARKRLNKMGLDKYWSDYLTRVQTHDSRLVDQRNIMYQLDFEFIDRHLLKSQKPLKVLDVGCGNGSFLDVFTDHGYECYGVEFGEEAAKVASKGHIIYYGEFPALKIEQKYDLIIFRGVLQYVPYPKSYLDKAVSLLVEGGHVFITAQPNIESFCFNLFKNKFTLPVNYADFIGYSEKIFTTYFADKHFVKTAESYFYEETPYADIEEDILKVAKAIECKRNHQKIMFKSPAFWGNMMSLIYQKS